MVHVRMICMYVYLRRYQNIGTKMRICTYVDLRRYQNIGTKMRILFFQASHYTTAVHSTESGTATCSMVCTAAARRSMCASFNVKSV